MRIANMYVLTGNLSDQQKTSNDSPWANAMIRQIVHNVIAADCGISSGGLTVCGLAAYIIILLAPVRGFN
jgi:hypothetical protein